MSIKELFEKLFGGIAKLFTAKNGVRNFLLLIICFFIGSAILGAILDYVDERNDCREMVALQPTFDCEKFKDLFGEV